MSPYERKKRGVFHIGESREHLLIIRLSIILTYNPHTAIFAHDLFIPPPDCVDVPSTLDVTNLYTRNAPQANKQRRRPNLSVRRFIKSLSLSAVRISSLDQVVREVEKKNEKKLDTVGCSSIPFLINIIFTILLVALSLSLSY